MTPLKSETQTPLRIEEGLIVHGDQDKPMSLGFLMNFKGHGIYDPGLGLVDVTQEQADRHNEILSKALVLGLDQNCEVGQGGTFYTTRQNGKVTEIKTWTGYAVSTDVTHNGRVVTFRRNGHTYRGQLPNDGDYLNFRRIS
jgi:hypothetical protein